VILIAGLFQFTSSKARHLACCLQKPECGRTMQADTATAWRHGLRLGLDCSYCCAGLMTILLVMGVMNLGAMAVVAALINGERLAPVSMRVVQAIGVLVIASGSFLIARAAGIA
jgi:predicted metal-binding membrane protein